MELKKPAQDQLLQQAPAQCQPLSGQLGDALFFHAVEQADIAVSITDAKANILYVNPAFSRVTGYTTAEAVGNNESMLSNKTTPPEVYRALWLSISRGKAWNGRLVNKRKNGSRYLAELNITPVMDAHGAIVNYLGLHRDLTEVHQLECKVRNQKALIESVVDGAPVVLALLDENDKVVLDNHEYKKLMADLSMAEPAPLLLNAVQDFDRHAVDGREGYAFLDQEVRLDMTGTDAARWFSCSGVWVKVADDRADAFFAGQSHTYLLLLAKETTVQRSQQEKARMAALQALVAEEERINALRESLSAAVFQLEGPLNMIGSAVNLMARRGKENDPMSAALSEALRAGEEALDRLRTMIPRQSKAMVTTNVNELLRSALDLCTGRLLAAGISVAWKPQSILPPIKGTPTALLSLFKSLLDNAIDAMNTRGCRERELTLTTCCRGNDVEIRFQDTGPGIPEDLRIKVFEPFFTTKQTGRHMGTGLATAQQILMDHGGTITIEPSTHGCCVQVLLPLTH